MKNLEILKSASERNQKSLLRCKEAIKAAKTEIKAIEADERAIKDILSAKTIKDVKSLLDNIEGYQYMQRIKSTIRLIRKKIKAA